MAKIIKFPEPKPIDESPYLLVRLLRAQRRAEARALQDARESWDAIRARRDDD